MQKIPLLYIVRQTPIWQLTICAFMFCLAYIISLAIAIGPTDRQLILHYSIPFGIDLIGSWYALWWYPAAGVLLFLVNGFFAVLLYSRDKVLSIACASVSLSVQVFVFIGVILLIIQNRS